MPETKVVKIDPRNMKDGDFEEAVKLLRADKLVAFPTETVYGLGGNALNPEASAKIYAAKGRPSDNPLIVHIADPKELEVLCTSVPETARRLARKFWPGPLTMILNKSGIVPKSTTGGLDTVAVRLPSHPIARRLIELSGLYIAAPSANASGRPSTTRAEHVIEDLDGRIDMVIDGGSVEIGLESTIVDLTGEIPLILRPGFITIEKLRSVIPEIEYDKAVVSHEKNENIVAKAPGMKYRHYAPTGDLTICQGDLEKVIETINVLTSAREAEGKRTAVLATSENFDRYSCKIVKSVGSRNDEEGIAAVLFDILREFDELNVDYIYSESFEESNLGQAIMNRLLKAAGYSLITV